MLRCSRGSTHARTARTANDRTGAGQYEIRQLMKRQAAVQLLYPA